MYKGRTWLCYNSITAAQQWLCSVAPAPAPNIERAKLFERLYQSVPTQCYEPCPAGLPPLPPYSLAKQSIGNAIELYRAHVRAGSCSALAFKARAASAEMRTVPKGDRLLLALSAALALLLLRRPDPTRAKVFFGLACALQRHVHTRTLQLHTADADADAESWAWAGVANKTKKAISRHWRRVASRGCICRPACMLCI